jgi:arylformamidase
MEKNKTIKLSYPLSIESPTYGNRIKLKIHHLSNIKDGNKANETAVYLPMHCGTHIDLPYHFYENSGFNYNDIYEFYNITIFEINSRNRFISLDDLKKINIRDNAKCDCLLIKTGQCNFRSEDKYVNENIGINESAVMFIRQKFNSLKVLLIDSISVTPIGMSDIGYNSHRALLNPENPILIVEDCDFRNVDLNTKFKKITIIPLDIKGVEAMPVSIFGSL